MGNIKENNKLINILLFSSVLILLLPFIPLLKYDELHSNNQFFGFVSLTYVMFMVFTYLVIKNKLSSKGIKNISIVSYIDKFVVFMVLGLLIPALFCGNKLNFVEVIKRIVIIFTVPVYKLAYEYFEINRSIRNALYFCTAVGIAICFTESFYLHRYRPGGFTLNANTWSAYLGFVIPLLIFGVWKSKNYISVYSLISLGALLCIFLAKSRAMLLSLGCVSICYIINKIYKYNRKLCLIVMLIGTLFLFGIAPKFLDIISRGYDNDRFATYFVAWKMFVSNPLFGVGYSLFEYTYSTQFLNKVADNILPHAHCMYLQYLATTGIVGFCGLMGYIICYLKQLSKLSEKNNYYYVGIVSLIIFLLHGIFDSVISVFYCFRYCFFFLTIYQLDIFSDIDSKMFS